MHTDPRSPTPARPAVPVPSASGAKTILTALLVVCLALAAATGAVAAGATPSIATHGAHAASGAPAAAATPTQLANATATQSETPRLTTTTASVEPGGTTTITVLLTAAPDGLAGYELVVSLSDDSAVITGASYPDGFGLSTDPAVAEDGSSVTLEAADTSGTVESAATNATLATVTVQGESPGEVSVELDARQLDADGGGELAPEVVPGTVTVGDPTTATPADGSGDAGADSDADAGESGSAAGDDGTETSVTTALPLAGIGVSLLAILLVAGLLSRRD
jgi:hypothetical protein